VPPIQNGAYLESTTAAEADATTLKVSSPADRNVGATVMLAFEPADGEAFQSRSGGHSRIRNRSLKKVFLV
jgi:hypothetical protein